MDAHGDPHGLERLLGEREAERYALRLYVTGMTSRSTDAVAGVRSLCEELRPGRFDLEVIDLYQQPARARSENVIASPTLVRESPRPMRRVVGFVTDRARVRRLLGLAEEPTP